MVRGKNDVAVCEKETDCFVSLAMTKMAYRKFSKSFVSLDF